MLHFIENRVVSSVTADERIQLQSQNLKRIVSRDNAIVWSLIMSEFLLPGKFSVELEAINIALILQIKVLFTRNDLINNQ